MATFRELYFNRRVGMMLPLGFASGLPLALTGDTLAAWASEAGVSLTGIGLLGLVSLPYTLKFLWAPVIDRYTFPFLDRRRSWLVLFQLLLLGAISAMAMFDPVHRPMQLAAMAVLVAMFSASQDICVDAYRTDILAPEQRGSGSAVFVGGYRLGMIVSGGLALILADKGLSWPAVYVAMALAMAVGIAGTLLASPAPAEIKAPTSLRRAVVEPLKQILLRRGGWMILAFIIIYKLPELMAAGYTTPFLLKIGISKTDIGWIRQTFGLAVTIVGTLAGGVMVGKLGLKRSLWVIGVLQPLSNLGFFVLAQYPSSRHVLVSVIGVENFVIGLVTAGFGAFLMAQCDRRYSAFQYALFSSAMAITRVVGIVPAGKFAEVYGWSAFFTLTIVVAVPGLLLLPFLPETAPVTAPEQEPAEAIAES